MHRIALTVPAAAGILVAAFAFVAAGPQVGHTSSQLPAAYSLTADRFAVDPVHSSLIFKVRHAGLSSVWGRLNNVQGEFTIDAADPAESKLHIHGKVLDLDTGNQQRDAHLAAPDFFNARQYPTISFVSTTVKPAGEGRFEVTGEMTMHGVTKPLTITIEKFVAKDIGPPMGYRAGFETQFTLKRSDFGIDLHVTDGMLGDEITIYAGIEGVRE